MYHLSRLVQVVAFLVVISVPVNTSMAQRSHPDAGPAVKRPVTVTDAIEMTQTGDRRYLDGYRQKGSVGIFSADGGKAAFVTQKGNVAANTVKYSLWVFTTANLFHGSKGDLVVTMESSSNREAITQVRWIGNDAIAFLGERPGETPQLYKVRCSTRKLRRLTNERNRIIDYSIDTGGDRFIYIAQPPQAPPISREMFRTGFAVSSEMWTQIYTNGRDHPDNQVVLFVKTPQLKEAHRIPGLFDVIRSEFETALQISSTGRYAIVRTSVKDASPAWQKYRQSQLDRLARVLLIDIDHFKSEPLWDAPVLARSMKASITAWVPGRDTVIVVNGYLPRSDDKSVGRSSENTAVCDFAIDVNTRNISVIATRQQAALVKALQWDSSLRRFITVPWEIYGGLSVAVHEHGGIWTEVDIRSGEQNQRMIELVLEQDLNSPPKLVAIDHRTEQRAVLLDLNPQFANLALGRVEVISWEASDGHQMRGELYYPANYISGVRYPLVIQTHAFNPERFWIDGPWGTAFAAQPLASRGIIVLQTDSGADVAEVRRTLDTAAEAPREMASYEGAIDHLEKAGLVDTRHVGLLGFSRTAYHVLYAITHSQVRFSATVVADGTNFGYVNCLFYYLPSGLEKMCETMNGGGAPFGPAFVEGWQKAPTFNLDKVTSPLLLQSITAPLGEWEIYLGLRWLHKPVALINFYPEGSHTLVQPKQRLLSQQSTVDWFRFWLKGEEDPDPAKAEQYARWRELRKLQQQNEKNSPTQSPN